MSKKAELVNLKSIRVCLGGKIIIENTNLEIGEGEFVSIVGKSGSGKSTLLHVLTGFVKIESGTVQVSSHVGFVHQKHPVFPWLTVRDNILFGLSKIKKDERETLLKSSLEKIGLGERNFAYPSELSGGEIQRVALARVLVRSPNLILMDEPFGALDAYTRERMQEWLISILENDKKAVIFVTHSIDEAVFMSDRILLLANQRLEKEWLIDIPKPRRKEVRFLEKFSNYKREITESLLS